MLWDSTRRIVNNLANYVVMSGTALYSVQIEDKPMLSNGRPIFLKYEYYPFCHITCNEGLVAIYQNLIHYNSFKGVVIHQSRPSRGWVEKWGWDTGIEFVMKEGSSVL